MDEDEWRVDAENEEEESTVLYNYFIALTLMAQATGTGRSGRHQPIGDLARHKSSGTGDAYSTPRPK